MTGARTRATADKDEEECSTAAPQPDQAGPRLIASRRQTLALAGASVIALRGNRAAADDSAPVPNNSNPVTTDRVTSMSLLLSQQTV